MKFVRMFAPGNGDTSWFSAGTLPRLDPPYLSIHLCNFQGSNGP